MIMGTFNDHLPAPPDEHRMLDRNRRMIPSITLCNGEMPI